jgi:hypothetical protein
MCANYLTSRARARSRVTSSNLSGSPRGLANSCRRSPHKSTSPARRIVHTVQVAVTSSNSQMGRPQQTSRLIAADFSALPPCSNSCCLPIRCCLALAVRGIDGGRTLLGVRGARHGDADVLHERARAMDATDDDAWVTEDVAPSLYAHARATWI